MYTLYEVDFVGTFDPPKNKKVFLPFLLRINHNSVYKKSLINQCEIFTTYSTLIQLFIVKIKLNSWYLNLKSFGWVKDSAIEER